MGFDQRTSLIGSPPHFNLILRRSPAHINQVLSDVMNIIPPRSLGENSQLQNWRVGLLFLLFLKNLRPTA